LAFCMEILPNQPDFSDLPAFIVGLLLLTCYNSRRGARCIYEFDEEKKEDAERLLSVVSASFVGVSAFTSPK
jgi:hypothetical protein